MAFRILSLNAWGGRVIDPLVPFLRDAGADVYCLQEVTRTKDAPAEWLTYRDGDVDLLQRANLFDEIKAVLPDHDGSFYPVARGPLFVGDETVWAEFGLATFVHRRHAVISQRLEFVHGQFRGDGWGEHPRSRNAHCIRLFDPRHGRPLTIAHMHGLRDPAAGKSDTPARRKQADALVQLVESVWHPGEGLVVCGDLNVLPQSYTFEALGRLGLADLVTSRGHSDTRTSWYSKPGRFADYMLTTPGIGIARFEVVEQPEVSDHRPLLLDLDR